MTDASIRPETSLPEGRLLEDGPSEGLTQLSGLGLAVLADPGQVSREVDQELVVGLRDAERLQDRLELLPTLLHARTLYKTTTEPQEFCFVRCNSH